MDKILITDLADRDEDYRIKEVEMENTVLSKDLIFFFFLKFNI